MLKWKCYIPGKQNTDWEGGYFPLTMEFSEDYPAKPPKVSNPPRHLRKLGCISPRLKSPSLVAVQIPKRVLPPKHLPVRNSVPQHTERGEPLLHTRLLPL